VSTSNFFELSGFSGRGVRLHTVGRALLLGRAVPASGRSVSSVSLAVESSGFHMDKSGAHWVHSVK
jgi:hypothetical protein